MILYRNFDIKARAAGEDEGGESRCIVEGYASTFGEPYLLGKDSRTEVWEQVDAKAFDGADMTDVIFQFDHGGRVFARQSNGTLEIKTDKRGLFVRADLSGTDEGRSLYRDIQGGYITRMSFAFTVRRQDAEEREGAGEDGRDMVLLTIAEVERVYDVSAVSIPANPGTEIAARMAEYAKQRAAEPESAPEPEPEPEPPASKESEERERLALLLAFDIANQTNK